MGDTVTTNVVYTGPTKHVVQLINTSDGTGESAVIKVDKSALTSTAGVAPDNLALMEVQWNIHWFTAVDLLWDHTTDDEMLTLNGNGYKDFREHGALYDPGTTGGTGDVLLTTVGAISGATYDIVLSFQLRD